MLHCRMTLIEMYSSIMPRWALASFPGGLRNGLLQSVITSPESGSTEYFPFLGYCICSSMVIHTMTRAGYTTTTDRYDDEHGGGGPGAGGPAMLYSVL